MGAFGVLFNWRHAVLDNFWHLSPRPHRHAFKFKVLFTVITKSFSPLSPWRYLLTTLLFKKNFRTNFKFNFEVCRLEVRPFEVSFPARISVTLTCELMTSRLTKLFFIFWNEISFDETCKSLLDRRFNHILSIILKPSCHIPFMHAFYTLRCVFLVFSTYLDWINHVRYWENATYA